MGDVIEALIPGGQANPGPPLGPALGPLGVNIKEIVDSINEKTADFNGMQVPIKIIFDDKKNYNIEIGTPPTSAPALGLGVIVITPGDASRTGILGQVATAVAEYGLSIRQAVTEDPYLTENPLLTIITDDNIPGELIDELKKVPGVKGVTIY